MKVAIGILVGIGLLPFLFPRRFWPTVIPILLAIWIPIACIVLATLIHFSSVMQIMILGTALWAAIDSSKIQLNRYKSGISYGPVVVFLCFVFLWIVAFPWYLIVRNKIKAGTATLKDEITKMPPSHHSPEPGLAPSVLRKSFRFAESQVPDGSA